MPSAALPTEIYRDDHARFAHWHNLQIIIFRGALQMAHIDVIEEGCRALQRRHGAMALGLQAILPHKPIAGPAVCARAARKVKELQGVVRHVSTALLLDGVEGLLVRATLRSFNVLGRAEGHISLHDSVASACQVLVPLVRETRGLDLVATELERAVATVREGYA